MKVKYKDYMGRVTQFETVAHAVDHALEPDAYSYDGELERMNARISKQGDAIGRIVNVLADKGLLTAKQLDEILGYGYEVEE